MPSKLAPTDGLTGAPAGAAQSEPGTIDPGAVNKRSVVIAGHKTSVSLENAFWEALRSIAAERLMSVNELIGGIDRERAGNLSSAIRVFVLESFRN